MGVHDFFHYIRHSAACQIDGMSVLKRFLEQKVTFYVISNYIEVCLPNFELAIKNVFSDVAPKAKRSAKPKKI